MKRPQAWSGIPASVVKRFLDRRLNDYRSYKLKSEVQLQAEADHLPHAPPIWSKLRKLQKVCLLLGIKERRFAFFADTGCGKSLISIALTRYFLRAKEIKTVLVLVPNKPNKSEWAREIAKHSPLTEYCILKGSSEHKWKQLTETKALMVIETYSGFARMACELKEVTKGKRKGRNRLTPRPKLVKALVRRFQGVFLDESNAVQSHNALAFRIVRQMGKDPNTVIFELTATPFGRDPTALWGQLFLLDRGETLGPTLGLFRAAFFKSTQNYWGGVDHHFDRTKRELLNKVLANRSIRYEADDADLPKVVEYQKLIDLPEEAQAYYDRAKETVIAAHGNFRDMQNGFIRMRQISSGFMGYHDDEMGTKAKFEFPENPKLDALMDLLESIDPEKKVLVFHDFRFSGQVLARTLKAAKIPFVQLTKGVDQDKALHDFDHDPKLRVFVLSTAGAYGLNLQVAQYGIFYESPVPVILRKQMRRRFERQYSKHKTVFLYDLITKGTVDQQILEFHRQGKSLFDAIVEGKVKPR